MVLHFHERRRLGEKKSEKGPYWARMNKRLRSPALGCEDSENLGEGGLKTKFFSKVTFYCILNCPSCSCHLN